MKKILSTCTILAALVAILGGMYTYDQGLAKAADVVVMREEIRLLHKRFTDEQRIRRIQVVQERLWTLEDRYHTKAMPQSVKEERIALKLELLRLERGGDNDNNKPQVHQGWGSHDQVLGYWEG